MTRKYFYNNRLRHVLPFAAASFTVGLALFACSDKDIDSNENNGKTLVAFNVSEKQDEAQAAAKANQPVTRAAFANQLALQDLAPEDLTMQKLPVQGKASNGLCLIETTLPGVPSQLEATAQTRADITTLPNMGNFSTTAFYGSSDTSLEPWFYDKDTKKDGNLVTPFYWDWFKNHGCFYAVYPKPDNNKIKLSPESYAGTPYVNFEVEPDVKNQKDLMTACSGNVHTDIGAMSATAPRTDLTFRHALTAVRFKVGQNLSYSHHITKVEIVNAMSKGKYTLPTDKDHTGIWDAASFSTPATFTLSGINVSTSTAVNNIIMGANNDNYVFYMIPQSLTSVQVKIYFDGNNTMPAITANLSGQWKPGTTKTYALSQNASDWSYQLTVFPPSAAEYNTPSTDDYIVKSYRLDGISGNPQPVPWKVIGYDANGDNVYTMEEKPDWMSLTKLDGKGSIGMANETGQAMLQVETIGGLSERNGILKKYPKGSASNYYDLSLHDVKGNSTLRNTANCYVISHPGYYKIPLVYGNAITNGEDNFIAYAPSGAGWSLLKPFKDHNNQDITNPWIEKTNGGANNGVDGAKLVWADEAGLVQFGTNKIVRDAGGNAFVLFEVPMANIKNGNAVIAVTKGGVVVWSWHLWFVQEDVLNTITCVNDENREYKFIQEPLGMKYTAWSGTTYTVPRSVRVKIVQKYGQGSPTTPLEGIITITQKPSEIIRQGFTTLYQAGRKDAFPGTDAIQEGNFNKSAGNNMSIPNGIQHPENFYSGGTSWTSPLPTGYAWTNLWSANNLTLTINDKSIIKTVYDPCPAGYKMPPPNAFSFVFKGAIGTTNPSTYNTFGAWNRGFTFYNKRNAPDATIYFPTTGLRVNSNLINQDIMGVYWAATPSNNNGSTYALHFYNNHGLAYMLDYMVSYPNSAGGAVRPIADVKTSVRLKGSGSTEEQWGSEQQVGGTEIDLDN